MNVRLLVLDAALIAVSAAEVWATRRMGGDLALAVACAGTAALLVRRRAPLVALTATLPALSLGYIWLAPMATLYQVAATPRRRGVIIGCALTVAVVSFYPWPWLGPVNWGLSATVLALLLSLLLAVAPTALGLLTASRRELAQRLAELAESRERERILATEQAIVRERARLAREMHDTVAHHITLIAVQSGALEATAQGPEARAAASAVQRLSREALDELRSMVGLLRMPVSSGLPGGPVLADLPALLAAAGPEVLAQLDTDAEDGYPAPVQHAAYRIVQEALTNVRKHAPGAKTEVVVRREGGGLLVSVRNGPAGRPVPLPLPSGGHGLTGLRERATQLGGTFRAGPEGDGGFLVHAVLPLSSNAGRA